MENPGGTIISRLGAGSGVDFLQLADDLSAATFDFRRSDLASRNAALEARISSAALLRSTLTGLASALGDRLRNGDLAPRASIGNPSVASVATTPGLPPSGRYSLEVTQLARGQTLASRSFGTASDPVGEGTLTIRFGTVDGATFSPDAAQDALAIEVGPGDTLASLASRISSQSGGALSAYVADGTDGAQLVIKGREGAANGFVIEPSSTSPSPTATPGDLTYLAWNPASDAGELRADALDAIYRFDTIERSSPSNTVTGLPEGLTLNLTATNIGAPTTLSFSNNSGAITGVMSDFVAALNDLANLLNTEGAVLGGTLGNDAGARELRRDLARLTTQTVMPNVGDGEPSTLADLGLRLSREGTFELDAARLEQTLANSPEGTAAMFTTGPFGVFATIDRFARDNSLRSDPGSLGGSLVRYQAQVDRNEEKLARIAEDQDNLRARLTRDFVAAERRIAASQSTLTFLQQQIEAWNGSN